MFLKEEKGEIFGSSNQEQRGHPNSVAQPLGLKVHKSMKKKQKNKPLLQSSTAELKAKLPSPLKIVVLGIYLDASRIIPSLNLITHGFVDDVESQSHCLIAYDINHVS